MIMTSWQREAANHQTFIITSYDTWCAVISSLCTFHSVGHFLPLKWLGKSVPINPNSPDIIRPKQHFCVYEWCLIWCTVSRPNWISLTVSYIGYFCDVNPFLPFPPPPFLIYLPFACGKLNLWSFNNLTSTWNPWEWYSRHFLNTALRFYIFISPKDNFFYTIR